MHGRSTVTTKTVRPPVTGEQLEDDLLELGVERGEVLLVHASLSSLGWVAGGAPAVVSALGRAVGREGHVVVPTGTEANSKTSRVHQAHIAMLRPDEVPAYWDTMPAFDKDTTPSGMGAISEALRTADGAVRSAHPQSSFAAIGPQADLLMADHPLECHLGPDSPLGTLYKMNARVLMIDVGYWAFTGFHLAEYMYTAAPPSREYACVMTAADGTRCWQHYDDVVLDDRKFDEIGQSLEQDLEISQRKVGQAWCRLVPLHPAVDFAVKWLAGDRGDNRARMQAE
jgi:aminoglycoside 3-N-acetyltransferase